MERFAAIQLNKRGAIDLTRICRLCGIDIAAKIPILQTKMFDDGEPELWRKILACVGIKVTKFDKMPPNMCILCHDKILDFFEFREMCSSVNIQTRKMLGLPFTEKMEKKPRKRKSNDDSKDFMPDQKLSKMAKIDTSEQDDKNVKRKQRKKKTDLNADTSMNIPKIETEAPVEIISGNNIKTSTKVIVDDSKKDNFCAICEKTINTIKFDEHLANEHLPLIVPYHCVKCNETIMKKPEIKNHTLWHKLSKTPFECGRCGKNVETLVGYTRHLNDCLQFERKYIVETRKCKLCDELFETQNLYDWHPCVISTLTCPKCNKVSKSKIATLKHIMYSSCNFVKSKVRQRQQQQRQNEQQQQPQQKEQQLQQKQKQKHSQDTQGTQQSDNQSVFMDSNAVVMIPSASQSQPVVNLVNLTESPNTKKHKKITRKDIQRVDNLLKNAYETLQNIKQEPKDNQKNTTPLPPDLETTNNIVSELETEDQLNIADQSDSFGGFDEDIRDYDDSESEVENNEAINSHDIASGIRTEIQIKQEQIDINYLDSSAKQPIIKLKIKKEHGQLNSSLVRDENSTEIATSASGGSGEDSTHIKKKRKKKKESTNKIPNDMQLMAPKPLTFNIKQEPIDGEKLSSQNSPIPFAVNIKPEPVDRGYSQVEERYRTHSANRIEMNKSTKVVNPKPMLANVKPEPADCGYSQVEERQKTQNVVKASKMKSTKEIDPKVATVNIKPEPVDNGYSQVEAQHKVKNDSKTKKSKETITSKISTINPKPVLINIKPEPIDRGYNQIEARSLGKPMDANNEHSEPSDDSENNNNEETVLQSSSESLITQSKDSDLPVISSVFSAEPASSSKKKPSSSTTVSLKKSSKEIGSESSIIPLPFVRVKQEVEDNEGNKHKSSRNLVINPLARGVRVKQEKPDNYEVASSPSVPRILNVFSAETIQSASLEDETPVENSEKILLNPAAIKIKKEIGYNTNYTNVAIKQESHFNYDDDDVDMMNSSHYDPTEEAIYDSEHGPSELPSMETDNITETKNNTDEVESQSDTPPAFTFKKIVLSASQCTNNEETEKENVTSEKDLNKSVDGNLEDAENIRKEQETVASRGNNSEAVVQSQQNENISELTGNTDDKAQDAVVKESILQMQSADVPTEIKENIRENLEQNTMEVLESQFEINREVAMNMGELKIISVSSLKEKETTETDFLGNVSKSDLTPSSRTEAESEQIQAVLQNDIINNSAATDDLNSQELLQLATQVKEDSSFRQKLEIQKNNQQNVEETASKIHSKVEENVSNICEEMVGNEKENSAQQGTEKEDQDNSTLEQTKNIKTDNILEKGNEITESISEEENEMEQNTIGTQSLESFNNQSVSDTIKKDEVEEMEKYENIEEIQLNKNTENMQTNEKIEINEDTESTEMKNTETTQQMESDSKNIFLQSSTDLEKFVPSNSSNSIETYQTSPRMENVEPSTSSAEINLNLAQTKINSSSIASTSTKEQTTNFKNDIKESNLEEEFHHNLLTDDNNDVIVHLNEIDESVIAENHNNENIEKELRNSLENDSNLLSNNTELNN